MSDKAVTELAFTAADTKALTISEDAVRVMARDAAGRTFGLTFAHQVAAAFTRLLHRGCEGVQELRRSHGLPPLPVPADPAPVHSFRVVVLEDAETAMLLLTTGDKTAELLLPMADLERLATTAQAAVEAAKQAQLPANHPRH